jgi:hypothetical protein
MSRKQRPEGEDCLIHNQVENNKTIKNKGTMRDKEDNPRREI